MSYKGHVKNGVVVLDEPAVIADGVEVRIEVLDRPTESTTGGKLSLAQRLASVIGKAEGFPDDWSENHDDYLREQHRK